METVHLGLDKHCLVDIVSAMRDNVGGLVEIAKEDGDVAKSLRDFVVSIPFNMNQADDVTLQQGNIVSSPKSYGEQLARKRNR